MEEYERMDSDMLEWISSKMKWMKSRKNEN